MKENNKILKEKRIVESAVADIDNVEMTPEIEQELNKIYEEKEGIDMKNNISKKGAKITNGKDATIYLLGFLKDNLKMFRPYLLDWSRLIENEDILKSIVIEHFAENNEKNYIKILKNKKLENIMYENAINKVIDKIDNAIKTISKNSTFKCYKCVVNDINNSIKNLNIILECFSAFSDFLDSFYMESSEFYNNIVSVPIFRESIMIKSIIDDLNSVSKEIFEINVENY